MHVTGYWDIGQKTWGSRPDVILATFVVRTAVLQKFQGYWEVTLLFPTFRTTLVPLSRRDLLTYWPICQRKFQKTWLSGSHIISSFRCIAWSAVSVTSSAPFWVCGRAERRVRTFRSLRARIEWALRRATRSQLQRQIASVCPVTFENSVWIRADVATVIVLK